MSTPLQLLQPDPDGYVPCPCGEPHGHEPNLIDTSPAAWRRLAQRILERDRQVCRVPAGGGICGQDATVCGHILARAFGGCDRPGNLRAECPTHSATDGQHTGQAIRAHAQLTAVTGDGPFPLGPPVPPETRGEPSVPVGLSPGRGAARFAGVVTPGPEDPVWDLAWWLEELRELPPEATWPRLMTLPHPEAVDTYGRELCAQFEARTGQRLRWWQRLAAYRLLEYDEAGNLIWLQVILTLARQLGKSWLLRELVLWRVQQWPRWGNQLVGHTARNLDVVYEVMEPAQDWARDQGWRVLKGNNRRLLETHGYKDGRRVTGRWLPRAHGSLYSLGAGLLLADECWDIPAASINSGAWPVLVEQTSPQLLQVSTAHPDATSLMLGKRATAVGQLHAPTRMLLLDWSGRPGCEPDSSGDWRLASPHWTGQRRELIELALADALGAEPTADNPDPVRSFRCQWLNQWPHDVEELEDPDGRVCTEPQWAGCLDLAARPSRAHPLVVAVEDDLGRSAAAAAAGVAADGRVVVGGYRFDTLAQAARWAERTAPAGVLLVGASVAGDPAVAAVGMATEPVGGSEFRAGLSALRALVRTGRLAHAGHPEATGAVVDSRVSAAPGAVSLRITGTDLPALLRCVVWAAHRAHVDRT